MNLEQQLASFWTMDVDQLVRFHALVGKMVELRTECQLVAPVAPQLPTPSPSAVIRSVRPSDPEIALVPKAALGVRRPMRPPKPGSLRATIRDVLMRNGEPMRRADIIRAVAAQRGEIVNDLMTAKVGDALTNKHDPIFRRLGHGIYTYAATE